VLPFSFADHHAMKAYWGSGGIAPCILDLGTRWRLVVSFTSRPLYPQWKSPCYPLDRKLDGFQNRSGHGGEEKNSQALSGPEHPSILPVAQRYTTEVSRFLLCYVLLLYVEKSTCIEHVLRNKEICTLEYNNCHQVQKTALGIKE
jgi:hypothetical protein